MPVDENLKLLERWLELYNTDVHRMVDELYTDDFIVLCPGFLEITDKASFHELEQRVLEAAPDRQIRIDRVLTVDNDVIIEAVLSYSRPDGTTQESHLCEILTFHDGLMTKDHAYIDMTTWPGIDKSK